MQKYKFFPNLTATPGPAITTTYPSPLGGLNARDSIQDMPNGDALVLNNWWVLPSTCVVRNGYTNWVTGFSAPVQTLAEYSPGTGTNTLFAASGTSIYDVTTPGTVGAAVQTGLSNALFQTVQITTAGGSYIYFLNGIDKPRLWNGTTWVSVDGTSTPAITGVTTTKLVNATLWKNRLFFVETSSTRAWFLPASSIGGTASLIDMGTVFRLGGYLMAVFPWTLDGGAGSDDLLIFISSNGEVAVYQGTDPASVTTFSLVGVFVIGRPLGRRCCTKYGGDVLFLCEEGVFPLSKALIVATINYATAVTDKVKNSIVTDVNFYKFNTGWELTFYPEQSMLLLNVPNGTGKQYAMNTISQAWTTFTGWNAYTFLRANAGLLFGDNTSVKKAWNTNLDGINNINFDALSSFQYFDKPAQNKFFTGIRLYLTSTGTPAINTGINGNFFIQDPTGVLNFTPSVSGMKWGSMVWGTMVWGASLVSLNQWTTVGGVYNSAAVHIKGQNNGIDLQWSATDYMYQLGGLLG